MQGILADYMRKGGHTYFTANDGIDALMILDVMMPHLDGFSVCKLAREMVDMPIIMMTAKGGEEDKLWGYDYVTKPFSPRVLLAKVNALLRRASPAFCRSDQRPGRSPSNREPARSIWAARRSP